MHNQNRLTVARTLLPCVVGEPRSGMRKTRPDLPLAAL